MEQRVVRKSLFYLRRAITCMVVSSHPQHHACKLIAVFQSHILPASNINRNMFRDGKLSVIRTLYLLHLATVTCSNDINYIILVDSNTRTLGSLNYSTRFSNLAHIYKPINNRSIQPIELNYELFYKHCIGRKYPSIQMKNYTLNCIRSMSNCAEVSEIASVLFLLAF
jgi:hypothetical protein